MTRRYSHNGRAHHAMAHLHLGPASFADVCQACGNVRAKDRSKTFLTLQALREDGFVRRAGPESYEITEPGSALLERLRAGESVVVEQARPNVRVFGRAA